MRCYNPDHRINRHDLLERYKRQLDLHEILRDVLGVNDIIVRGDELNISCPIPGGHRNGDANPSASINAESYLFNCFGCGAAGDLIWLVQQVKDCTLGEAIENLDSYLEGENFSLSNFVKMLNSYFDPPQLVKRERIHFSEKVLEQWIQHSTYMVNRGVSFEIQDRMKTGLGQFLEREKIVVSRAVIPHFFEHELVGWTSRLVYPADAQVPKYAHSLHFPKSDTLYNYDNCKGSDQVFVVESPISVLVLMSHGIENVMATFGAVVVEGQIDLLRDFRTVTVWPDGDQAGERSAKELVRQLGKYCRVNVVLPTTGADPADMAEGLGKEANVREHIEKRTVGGESFHVTVASINAQKGRESLQLDPGTGSIPI